MTEYNLDDFLIKCGDNDLYYKGTWYCQGHSGSMGFVCDQLIKFRAERVMINDFIKIRNAATIAAKINNIWEPFAVFLNSRVIPIALPKKMLAKVFYEDCKFCTYAWELYDVRTCELLHDDYGEIPGSSIYDTDIVWCSLFDNKYKIVKVYLDRKEEYFYNGN